MSDLEARAFTRRGNALVPSDLAAAEMLAEIKEGQEVLVTARKARNILHHRWFFSLLQKVVDNSDRWQTPEELLDALKLATGHVKMLITLDGEVYLQPRSISFAAMGELAFRRWRNRCCYLLATRVLGCTPEELMSEVDATQRRAA